MPSLCNNSNGTLNVDSPEDEIKLITKLDSLILNLISPGGIRQ